MIKCKYEISTKLIILLLCLISTIALFIRIQYINYTDIYKPIRADARQYVLYGYNLAHHGIFSKQTPSSNTPSPDSFRSPGYPLLIALSFLLGGDNDFYPIVIYTQIILSVLLVPLTFYLGIRFLPLWGATAAACLVAFSPHLISMTSYLLTETLFAFIFITAIICFYHAIKRQHVFKEALKGIKIKENRFGFEPEITAKIAKKKLRICEVPISYHKRSYEDGKKIGWIDGLSAIWCILKYNLLG